MTTQEIANRLIELVRAGDFKTVYSELYSPDIVSVENDGSKVNGLDGIAKKGEEWNASLESFNGSGIGDAIVSGNYFSLPMWMDVKFKGAPESVKFNEICVYQCKDGKVVKEQFFYDEPGQ